MGEALQNGGAVGLQQVLLYAVQVTSDLPARPVSNFHQSSQIKDDWVGPNVRLTQE